MDWENHNKGLVIHHWDADGISSAALLKKVGIEHNPDLIIDTYTPDIGNYFLGDEYIESARREGYDMVIIADIALPKGDVLKLEDTLKVPITFFDHHATELIEEIEHVNPVARGGTSVENPSCAHVVSEHFGLGFNIHSAIGAIGDQEERILENAHFSQKIKKFINENDTSFEELQNVVKLIDSNYIVNDYRGIKKVIECLSKEDFSLQDVTGDEALNENLKRIEETIKKYAVAEPTRIEGGVQVYEFNSEMNLISKITRELSRKNPDKVVVVVNREKGNVYVRRREKDIDLRRIVKVANDMGYNAGGKEEVAGLILPVEEIDDFVKRVGGLTSIK